MQGGDGHRYSHERAKCGLCPEPSALPPGGVTCGDVSRLERLGAHKSPDSGISHEQPWSLVFHISA